MKNRSIARSILCVVIAIVMAFAIALLPACSCNGEPDPGPGPGPGPDDPPIVQPDEDIVTPSASTGTLSAKGKFNPDFASFEEEQLAAKELTIKIAEEGDVLLKNANNALPLSEDEKNVTLFGITSVNLIEAGGGSGAGSTGANGITESTLKSSLNQAGFGVNQKTLDLYQKFQDLGTTTEIDIEEYTDSVVSTYRSYNDAAIITFGRVGTENGDCAMDNVPGHSDPDDHYLELDDNEIDLVKHVKKYFDKVIVLINSANIMEMAELNAEKTADNLGVDAIIWVGTTGNNAIDAVGGILNGTVNPSGHTVDLWSADFKLDPTWTNFGWQTQNKDGEGNRMDPRYYDEDGNETKYASVEYREDIYLGYKYYETAYDEMNAAEKDGEAWYKSRVVYPFGYGLSYTTFDWELVETAAEATIDDDCQTVTMKVKVTNTGDVAGKDVVQIYYTAPYTPGGIEKASTNLVTFGKTDILEPGESEVLTLRFVAQEMASYDWDDSNGNDFMGWELEAGDYIIEACRDSHTPVLSMKRTIATGINCETDWMTGNRNDPVFVDDFASTNSALLTNKLTRGDLASGRQPAPSTKADRTITDVEIAMLDDQDTYEVWEDQPTDPWYKTEADIPDGWTQAEIDEDAPENAGKELHQMSPVQKPTIMMYEMAGVAKDDPKWDKFMNQLTWETIVDLVANGADVGIGSPAIDYISKPQDLGSDGPVQIKGGTLFPSSAITAATYNLELAYEQGRMQGNDALFLGINEWLGPAMNTHRSPFGGRNFEYFSEDGMQGALIAAELIRGVTSKGVISYIKHWFANDQETYRAENGGIATWATEQTLREIYARPFEYAIKKGGSIGLMSSFNRIGYEVTAHSYAAMTKLLRDQFGFTGTVLTDMWTRNYCSANMTVRGGNDQLLANGHQYEKNNITHGEWDVDANCVRVPANQQEKDAGTNSTLSYTHWYSVRNCAKNILYAHVNSLGNKNGYSGLSAEVTVVRNAYNNVAFSVEGAKDVELVSEEGGSTVEGVDGITVNGSIVSGTVAADTRLGTYSVPLNLVVDGWAEATATLKINVVSAISVNGVSVDNEDHIVGSVKAGEKLTLDIASPYYAYGNIVGASGGFRGAPQVVNWWHSPSFHAGEGSTQQGRFNCEEDYTAADILVRDPSTFDDIYHDCTVDGCKVVPITADLSAYDTANKAYHSGEYHFEIVGGTAGGTTFDNGIWGTEFTKDNFKLTNVLGDVTGMTGSTYQAYTSAKLEFDATGLGAGKYDVNIMVAAPTTSRSNTWLLTNRGSVGIYFYVQTLTVEVTA